MVEHATASGSLTLSRRRRIAATTPAPGATKTLPRKPVEPAEVAQARVFERLLQAEFGELQELAHQVAGRESSDVAPDVELTQISARIDEIDGLLRALQGRFPHTAAANGL